MAAPSWAPPHTTASGREGSRSGPAALSAWLSVGGHGVRRLESGRNGGRGPWDPLSRPSCGNQSMRPRETGVAYVALCDSLCLVCPAAAPAHHVDRALRLG